MPGVRFAVWAPNAEDVTVAGEFNDWDIRRHPMRRRNGGVWEIFIPGLGEGTAYKYNVRSRFAGYQQLKADPYAFECETPPKSASVVWDIDRYQWNDAAWMERRAPHRLAEIAGLGLRSARRILDARPAGPAAHATANGRQAGRIREADGLHAHRAAAHHGASVLRARGATR